MHEIKLLLSAKLCAVGVLLSKVVRVVVLFFFACQRDQQGIYTKKATSNEVAFSNSVMNYYFFVNAS